MAERVEGSVAEGENTIEERHVGAMWELEQKLDQSMDEEANKLKIMYREKVTTFSVLPCFTLFQFQESFHFF